MKRRHSSTSLNESEGMIYAVFVALGKENHDNDIRYLIYKLDSVEGSGKDDVCELGPPIETLKLSQYPLAMSFFSVGSKLYFCGGFGYDSDGGYGIDRLRVYKTEAYMLDINSNQGIVEIPSMNFPKPIPYVCGPVDNHKFYIFSVSKEFSKFGCPTFEMLDTSTNLWENISIPDSISKESFHSSVVCGSNILISSRNRNRLFVFCTRTRNWRTIDDPFSIEPSTVPFVKASPLFHGNEYGHILLASLSRTCLPQVYLSWYLHLPLGMKDFDLFSPFVSLGEVDGLVEHLGDIPEFFGGRGIFADFFAFNDNRFCVVRAGEDGFFIDRPFAFDIFRVSYSGLEGLNAKINVKVENALRYKYCSNVCMEPKYFFVVG